MGAVIKYEIDNTVLINAAKNKIMLTTTTIIIISYLFVFYFIIISSTDGYVHRVDKFVYRVIFWEYIKFWDR